MVIHYSFASTSPEDVTISFLLVKMPNLGNDIVWYDCVRCLRFFFLKDWCASCWWLVWKYLVYLKGEQIKHVENEKLVGVIVNQNVSWEHPIKKTNKIVNHLLFLMRRIKKHLRLAARKLYLNSYILPHLDNCSAIWGASPTFRNWLSFRNEQQELFWYLR